MMPLKSILAERADDSGGVAEFGGLKRGAEHHQDLAFRHRHIERAEIEKRMPEGEDLLAVVIRDRAHAGGGHVARDENSGYGVARVEANRAIRATGFAVRSPAPEPPCTAVIPI